MGLTYIIEFKKFEGKRKVASTFFELTECEYKQLKGIVYDEIGIRNPDTKLKKKELKK